MALPYIGWLSCRFVLRPRGEGGVEPRSKGKSRRGTTGEEGLLGAEEGEEGDWRWRLAGGSIAAPKMRRGERPDFVLSRLRTLGYPGRPGDDSGEYGRTSWISGSLARFLPRDTDEFFSSSFSDELRSFEASVALGAACLPRWCLSALSLLAGCSLSLPASSTSASLARFFPRPVAGNDEFFTSSLFEARLEAAAFFFLAAAAAFRAASLSRRSLSSLSFRASSLFSSVGRRMRSDDTQSSNLCVHRESASAELNYKKLS